MVSAGISPKNNVRKYENLKSILANITFIRILYNLFLDKEIFLPTLNLSNPSPYTPITEL